MKRSTKTKTTKKDFDLRGLLTAATIAFAVGGSIGVALQRGVAAGVFIGVVFFAGLAIGVSLASDS